MKADGSLRPEVLCKRAALEKPHKNYRKNKCNGVLFSKCTGIRFLTLLKRCFHRGYFPVNS